MYFPLCLIKKLQVIILALISPGRLLVIRILNDYFMTDRWLSKKITKSIHSYARLETFHKLYCKLFHIFCVFFFWIRCNQTKYTVESLPPLWFLLFKRGEAIFFFIFAILDSWVWGTESWSEPLNQKQFRIKGLITLPPNL